MSIIFMDTRSAKIGKKNKKKKKLKKIMIKRKKKQRGVQVPSHLISSHPTLTPPYRLYRLNNIKLLGQGCKLQTLPAPALRPLPPILLLSPAPLSTTSLLLLVLRRLLNAKNKIKNPLVAPTERGRHAGRQGGKRQGF